MARHPDELVCDLAQYYHIYDMTALPPDQVAVLTLGLEDRSRTKKALAGLKADPEIVLLSGILDGVAWLRWAQTKDAARGKGAPEPLTPILLGEKREQDDLAKFDSGAAFDAARKKILERIERYA